MMDTYDSIVLSSQMTWEAMDNVLFGLEIF